MSKLWKRPLRLFFYSVLAICFGDLVPFDRDVLSPALAEASDDSPFLQILKDDAGRPATMSTSIVRYSGKYPAAPKKPPIEITVDLVSAVHIEEPSYYEALNQKFANYDAVLYELIAPDDLSMKERKALQEREGKPSNPVSVVQVTLQKALGLEFQLQKIDYTKPNFVHADLSPDGFAASLEERGDSIWSLFARLLIQGFVEQEKKGNPFESWLLLMAIVSSNDSARPFVLRRYLAENFRELDSLVEKIEGPKGSTLVTDRNRKALEVLKAQVSKGKKKFAIFYGAAHMPKFQESLQKDFGLHQGQIEWIPAWHLQPPGLPSDGAK